MSEEAIPFNWPYMTGKELYYIAESHFNGQLAGDGPFTKMCHAWLEQRCRCETALLTHSCTAALEMAALLLDIKPGDEVIMPSYTFVSTANAFVLRGAVPVFIDIRADTLNMDEKLIEEAITPRTRAIVTVHYAGVACEMDTISEIARRHRLMLVEDIKVLGRSALSVMLLGAYSFHETKNLISGEGGALLVNEATYKSRAEIIREKGTDRSRFFRGEVDKYTWQETGSSFLPGELIAAFLWAQFEEADSITDKRLKCWRYYHELLSSLEADGLLRRPVVPDQCQHNGHMYYVLLEKNIDRQNLLGELKKQKINSVFHYLPLHSSPAGRIYGKVSGSLTNTDSCSRRLIRLPLWVGLTEAQQERVVGILRQAILDDLQKQKRHS